MPLAKSGAIQNCCQPNAIITLKEYLEDYASDETKRNGELLIERELKKIPNQKVYNTTCEYLKKIEEGARDFRF